MSKKSSKGILGVEQGKFAELCGWYGMIALIVAYFLVSFGIIGGKASYSNS